MRYLILSDIHSNLEALDTVLRASTAHKCDAVLVLGDLVGYGADPNAVVDRVRALKPAAIVRGNHDKVAAGLESDEDFNALARASAEWTRKALQPSSLEYLRALPVGPTIVDAFVEICHGSPVDEDLYVVADADATVSLEHVRRPVCLFGHTHVAIAIATNDARRLTAETPHGQPEFDTKIVEGSKYLINPGSVGQPRDADPRAAYAVADLDRKVVTLHRVAYPIQTAQQKILDAGLPPMLAHRLAMGR